MVSRKTMVLGAIVACLLVIGLVTVFAVNNSVPTTTTEQATLSAVTVQTTPTCSATTVNGACGCSGSCSQTCGTSCGCAAKATGTCGCGK